MFVATTSKCFYRVNTDITNFYIGPAGNIGLNEIDYYTAILHEALHTMGFASRISFPLGNPITNFYTPWDLNLRNPTGDYLILSTLGGSGFCCADYKFNVEDFPGMPDIIWDQDCGPNNVQFDVAQLPPVNSEYPTQDPAKFNQVLSHLDRTCGTDHYIMHASIPNGTDGVQRILTPTEISILCKLGYKTDECDPDCLVIASKGGNFFVELNQTIQLDFSTLLSNDFPTNATLTYKPDCGSHSGLFIPLPVGNVFNITGLAQGVYTFCYTITTCDGRRCDATEVKIVVTPTNFNKAGCGNTYIESGNGCKRIRLYTSLQENISKSEGLMFPLCEPIFPGMRGQVTMQAMISNTCIIAGYNPQIKIELTENSPISNVNIYTNPGIDSPTFLESIVSSEATNPIYKTYTLPFQNTSDVCWNFMCLSGKLNGTFPGWLETFWFADDVKVDLSNELLETLEVNTSVEQSTPCLIEVVTFEIEVCNNIACLPNTFSSPEFLVTGILPPGLSHVPNVDFPSLSHLVLANEIPRSHLILASCMPSMPVTSSNTTSKPPTLPPPKPLWQNGMGMYTR